jgi:preprotein translocase subunit SecG
MTDMTAFYCFVLVCFILIIFICDLFLRKSKQYQEAIRNNTKPRRKLLIKRWWVWLIIVFLAFLMLIGNSSDDDDSDDSNTAKTEETHKSHEHSKKGSVKKQNPSKQITKKPSKPDSRQEKKERILKILNMWASKNNDYGTVKIGKDDAPKLILNDETVASSKSELKSIAIQFSNKIRVQQQMNHIEFDNPAIYDKDGTPIAVWNGSTLELVDK